MSSILLSLADVNDAGDDDDEMFAQRGPGGAGLGSLFANAAAASSSSLKYQPPKAPAQAQGTSGYGPWEDEESQVRPRPSFSSACVVDAWVFDKSTGSYKAEGKVGVALISSGKGQGCVEHAQALLVLYRSNRHKLALAAVDSAFRLEVQDDYYVCFNDSRSGETWSVRFGSESDLIAIAQGVAISKASKLLKNGAVIVQDIKLGQKESLPVTDRCVVDFTYSGWRLDLKNSCLGLRLDEGQKTGVTMGEDIDILRGWKMGMLGMKALGERFITVPPQFGYPKKDLPNNVPEGSTLAFLIRLDCVRPEVDHLEGTGVLSRSRLIVDKVCSKVGQSVVPIPRAQTSSAKSESEATSIQTEASTTLANAASAETTVSHLPASGTSISDLMLSESRLQNTELRMTLSRLDDKLEKLTSLVMASSSAEQKESNVVRLQQDNVALKVENEKLRTDTSALAHENLILGNSNQILNQDNKDLRRKLSEMEEGLIAINAKFETTRMAIGRGAPKAEQDSVAAEMGGALLNAEVHKKVKKVLGKVYKRLQSDFAGDKMMHSGKEVRELLANSIREMVSLMEDSDGRSDGSLGDVPVTTPVALVNPIHNNVSDKNRGEANF